MRKTACVIAMALVPAVAGADKARQPGRAKLVDEKAILTGARDDGARPVLKVGSMQLSPDGRQLLYLRHKKAAKAGARDVYELRLRTLATGRDIALPIPTYPEDNFPVIMLSLNVFGAGGKKIVLGAGVDENKDGAHSFTREMMQAALYDIPGGKVTMIGPVKRIVLSTFDGTGAKLILSSGDKWPEDSKLYTTPADKIQLKELARWGQPMCPCPADDLLPMLMRDMDKGSGEEFVLYDLKKDKVAARLPLHREGQNKLYRHGSRWTSGGRYLYYIDMNVWVARDGQKLSKVVTRIWDRKAGKLVGELTEAAPVGPGPTKTTMVLGRYGGDDALVHDAASGKVWVRPLIRPIAARADHILYVKHDDAGKEVLSRARIELPKPNAR